MKDATNTTRRRGAGVVATAAAALAVAAFVPVAEAQTFRVNILADPSMIDPITYSELVAGDVLGNVYEGFTAIDAEGNVVPALAESWEAHEGNLGFTFHLRPGVMTHLGNEFTAHDVKYTFEALLIPENRGGLNAEYLTPIVGSQAVRDGTTTDLEGVVVVDDYTVEVHFTEPDVLFPIYPFLFMDRRAVDELGSEWYLQASAGTGPFSFVEWARGQHVRLAAHDAYWGDGPYVDGVDFIIVPSPDTAVSMFEAGELDATYVEEVAIRRVLRDATLLASSQRVPAAQIRFMGMNQNLYAPFQDIRVREAICLSIDKDAMISGLYEGAALPLAGQVTPGVAGFNPALENHPYDPDRARALMAEAGFPNGQGLPPVSFSTTEPNRNEALYYASQFQEILGMPVEVEIVERGTFIRNMNAGEVPFFSWGWSAGFPDAMYFLAQVWYGPSPYNRARWSNAEFDALIDEARGIADAESRYALYHQAEQILIDDFGTCPLTVRMQLALVRDGIDGVVLSPFRFLPFNAVRM